MEPLELPHSLEAERALLGSIISDNKRLFDALEEKLTPDDFYTPQLKSIYKAILDVHARDLPVDYIQVIDTLKTNGELERVGGQSEVVLLVDEFCDPKRADSYARTVREKSTLRKISVLLRELSFEALASKDSEEFIVQMQARLLETLPSNLRKSDELLADSMHYYLEDLQKGPRPDAEIKTGFYDIDRIVKGLGKGRLIIVAGRPAMGKSSFATSIIQNQTDTDFSAYIFSQEMSRVEIAERTLSGLSGINSDILSSKKLNESQWDRVLSAYGKFSKMRKITTCDISNITTVEIRAKCQKKLLKDKRLDLVVVDYLGLLRSVKSHPSREREIAEMSRDLKSLSMELKVPIILMSQLNRECENRADKRPLLSDLRDSGSVEQDADIVCLIYRDEVYNKETSDLGVAEINIAKHRQGHTGTVKLRWNPEVTKFNNLNHGY